MLLRPTTPSGSPIPAVQRRTGWLTRIQDTTTFWLADRMELIVEPLDRPGRIATIAFLASTVSAAFAYAITLQLVQPHGTDWPVVQFLLRHGGGAAWAIACGAGFLSQQRLPRLLAGSIVVIAACFYGWEGVGLPGRVFPWNFIAHITLGMTLALPSLLAWVRRRFHDYTA
jgi:hypothetical protein